MSDTNKLAMPLDDLPRPGVAIPLQRWLDLLAIEQKCAKQAEEIARLRSALETALGEVEAGQWGSVHDRFTDATIAKMKAALTPAQPAAKI
jgi:hypothetical protein